MSELAEATEPSLRSDKSDHYWNFYADLFGGLRTHPLKIVEIGIFHGGSTLVLAQYFEASEILAVDIEDPPPAFYEELARLGLSDRVHVALVSQAEPGGLLAAVEERFGDQPLDLIIDDASHQYVETRSSFSTLFPSRLKPGGAFVIEDWGCGYWPSFPDGDSGGAHGLPRLIKELVDLVALPDRTCPEEGKRVLPTAAQVLSPVERAVITNSIAAFVRSDVELPDPELLFAGADEGAVTTDDAGGEPGQRLPEATPTLRQLIAWLPTAAQAAARSRLVRLRDAAARRVRLRDAAARRVRSQR